MKLVVAWEIGKDTKGVAKITIPLLQGTDIDSYLKKLSIFISTVDRLNSSLKESGAVVTRRIEK